jgi:hypothetical protein
LSEFGILTAQGSLYSLQAPFRPHFFGIIILLESGFAFGEPKPGELGGCINVDIRSQGTWVVECSDANESELRTASVVTPNRNLAFAAAIDVVRSVNTGNRDGFEGPTDDPYGRGLYDGIDDKCAASVPLAIVAVAAVHADRWRQQLVAHLAAGTTTLKFLSHAIGFLFMLLLIC